ncbi:MAG: hypothetical protein K2Y22_16340 [Candidatus Obscuribacterales bacterium]|nr:hypothetical protein [Candidatus Obscuribacterales bacterium]
MFRPEQDSTDLDLPKFRTDAFDTHSGGSVADLYAQSKLAYDADSHRFKNAGDGTLPPVEFHDSALEKLSDAPPNPPVLDENGRVESINYADGTSRQFTYKDGQIDTYKDKDGHLWKFSAPDAWTQQDGKSVLHGEMIVGKDGSFTFINHDKDYVSHYGADGKEKVDAQKKYDEYSKEDLIALEAAGKQFAATGLPQDSLEKPKQDQPLPPEATSEPRPQPDTHPVKPDPTVPPETSAEPKPQPEPEMPDPVKPDQSVPPETSTEPKPQPEPEKPEPVKPDQTIPPATTSEPKPQPVDQQAGTPLTPAEIAAFARNFGLEPAEIARISALPLEQLRSEMQAIPPRERNSQKFRFYGEMVYRLTGGKTSSAYGTSDIA